MIVALDREVLPIDARLQHMVDRVQKVVAMRPDMEPDQIRAQQAIQQFPLPRADLKGLGSGPGNMPENRNSCVWQAIFHHSRQQGEMIVLDQNHRMFLACHLLHESVGKLLIDVVVVLPVPRAKYGTSMGIVAKRPQAFVGKAVVVAVFLLRTQPYCDAECSAAPREEPAVYHDRPPSRVSASPLP